MSVLRSGHLVQGEKIADLEAALVRLLTSWETTPKVHSSEVPDVMLRAAAVSSGTTALQLTLLALDIGPGDEVVIPSYVCAALWHAVRATGATPVLADCDGHTFNICPVDAKKRLTDRTRAIIVPHLFGQAADLDSLLVLGVPVIEDCAQSLGSLYRGRPTGSFGVASVFSFYATKVIAAGEGGMVVSRDNRLISRIRDLRDYDEKDDLSFRLNAKLTDLQGALARSQLGKLRAFIARRRTIAGRYDRVLDHCGLTPPHRREDRDHIFFRYVFLTEAAEAFMTAMENRGVVCRRPVFRPLHRYLGQTGFCMTDKIWQRAVSIPLYPDLTEEEIAFVETALEESGRVILGGSAERRISS
ncbi:MAG: DegT/DnrJ/EryC1/StrS family aminotransferase [Syntrophobacterales bacterium]|nr:DegT/DnrJ/EryC1/StrS family aminotransferase [Syntrophobacterales bacterium]